MLSQDLKFGTSGLRGLSRILDGEPAVRFSRAFANVMIERGFLPQGGAVLLGRDLRASSPSIARLCAEGLRLAGVEPVDCGEVPTPALAAHGMALGAPAIMVTGSHIPEDRNGLKFYRPDGEIDKADEKAITEAEAALGPDPVSAGTAVPRRNGECLAQFTRRALGMLAPDALAGMRVGVYQHSSAMRDVLAEVLSALGADPVVFGRSDRFVPIDTEAMRPDDVQRCQDSARDHGLDAIVSTDGDADRPLVADETGEFLRGDLVGTIAAHMLSADCVVTPITSNSGIEKCGLFARVARTRIGSPYVIEGMKKAVEEGASVVVGFEANGGVLLGTDAAIAGRRVAALPTRDAMAPILAVLYAASRHPSRRISSLVRDYAFGDAAAGRLENVAASQSGVFLDQLHESGAFRSRFLAGVMDVASLDTTDGMRLTGEDGCVLHYRASGNAPELRCYVEAPSHDRAAALLNDGLARAREFLEELASR